MLIENLKRLVQVIILLALQVLLMNHIHILGYGTPLIGVALLLYVSVVPHRVTTLIWCFILGFFTDMFSNTPGVASSALLVTAMVQPWLLKLSTPKDSLEDMVPNYHTMGAWNHLRYMTILLFIHHLVYFSVESFSFYNYEELGISMGISFVLSWLSIAAMETLRGSKKQSTTSL